MISVELVNIPLYLREGGFYQGLDTKLNEQTESDEGVTVPADTLKADDTVTSNEELPQSVIAFVISDASFSETEDFKAFIETFPALTVLTRIRSSDLHCHPMPAFFAQGSPQHMTERACMIAIKTDRVDVLKYLVSIGVRAFPMDRLAAASLGSLNCLKYLHENVDPCDWQDAQMAAEHGHIHVLRFLHEEKCGWNKSVCAKAAECGQLECLKFLHEVGCPWNDRTIIEAAMWGHLGCLIYAHEEGLPLPDDVIFFATAGGHLECLKYARAQDAHWDMSTCVQAARCGHLNTLQHLHENGCPWDNVTTTTAAQYEKYDCLKYAVDNGCAWDLGQYEVFMRNDKDPEEVVAARERLTANCAQS